MCFDSELLALTYLACNRKHKLSVLEKNMTLVQALKNFNRKERYLLFQHAIGNHRLSPKFCKDLAEILKIDEIPAAAYWAIDYHFDWIAGAVTELAGLANRFPDAPFKQEEGASKLIMGNQEDIDLLIAFKHPSEFKHILILVEYKAGGEWSGQVTSKTQRINLLKKLIDSQIRDHPIDVHFVAVCPESKRPSNVHWLPLDYDDKCFARVERCDEHRSPDASGHYWQVKAAKTRSP
jgi:hypothetical protein